MNNKILMIFALLIILFLICGASGCKAPQMPWQKEREEITAGRGISARFRTNEPPLDGIYASDQENFKVAIELTNYGPNPVNVDATISDTPSDVFSSLTTRPESKYVPGAEQVDSKIYPGKAILDFGSFNYYADKIMKGMTTNIIVDLQTRYNVKLSPQICIKKPYAEIADVYCEDSTTLSGSDLGADANKFPVTVTRIEKQVWPVDDDTFNVHLRIFFNNLGNGKIFIEGEPTRQILKNIGVSLVGAKNFDCMPKELYLEEGERAITCDVEVDLTDEAVRRNPVLISFGYNYRVLASTGEIPIIITRKKGEFVGKGGEGAPIGEEYP